MMARTPHTGQPDLSTMLGLGLTNNHLFITLPTTFEGTCFNIEMALKFLIKCVAVIKYEAVTRPSRRKD